MPVTVVASTVRLPRLTTVTVQLTWSPTARPATGSGVIERARTFTGCTVTVAVDGADSTAVPRLVPVPIAVLVTVPASTSPWVSSYVEVQVTLPSGGTGVVGQLIWPAAPVPLNAVSVMPTPVTVVLPVLVTR
jgi:hypothetical protein